MPATFPAAAPARPAPAANAPVASSLKVAGPLRVTVVGAVLLSVLVVISASVFLFDLRNRMLVENERTLSNTALIVAKQIAQILATVQSVQEGIVEHTDVFANFDRADTEHKLSSHDIHVKLRDRAAGMPYVGSLTIVNAQGRVINFSRQWPIPSIDVTDRDFFKALQRDPTLTSFLSEPVRNRATDTWVMHLARRISGPSGEFLGLISAAIELQYLHDNFSELAFAPGSGMDLLRRDGTLLVRIPRIGSDIGRRYPGAKALQLVLAADHGVGMTVGETDGQAHVVAAYRVGSYPVLVAATRTVATVLADWQRTAAYVIVIAALTIAAITALSILFIKLFRNYHALVKARTDQENAEKFRDQSLRLDVALNNMSQGLVMFDASERIILCNRRYVDMYALSPDVVKPGCTLRQLLGYRQLQASFSGNIEEYRGKLLGDLAQGKTSSIVAENAAGRSYHVINVPMAGGGWVATHEDVTERKKSERQIVFMAHHDALTGLANRSAMMQQIEDAAARLHRRGEPFTVLLLDLDRFKYVNDTLGHPAGDALLRETATRLGAILGDTDVLARLGGDEFAIIQAGETSQREAASALADCIIDIVAKPFNIDGNEVSIGASIGIALAPEHATNPDNLLKMADLALYRAKTAGRNGFQFFHPEMSVAAGVRHELEKELRRAVQHDELELHYQPIVDAKTLRICGMEALIRWRHPTKGMIFPDQFIPIAEETGMIIQIGEWILHAACVEAATWPASIKVAVNLSAVQFRKSNLSDVVMYALAQSGLPPERLELEITETALMESAADCLPALRLFKNLGITVALDDFGTGYSSLSQLTMFPFDKIKIDKSFTQNFTKRADCAAIVSAALNLAQCLDIATTAEGVETMDQYRLLRLAGVTSLQGYLFARPCPIAEIDFDRVYTYPGIENAA